MPALILAMACAGGAPLSAQYFGQNKVRYKTLNFEVLKTEHFDIYYYPVEQAAAREVGRMAERWHLRLSRIFNHVLTSRQAIVLYASHTDFEQTNVIPGYIPESVGGVTTSRGRKVVIPLAGPLGATDHVLGHELVHAFELSIAAGRFSRNAGQLPLWFIEGLAEYLSLGPRDPNTAMWLRDAALHDKLPSLKDLGDPNKYFPYRFGHAFWAYVGGRYGDDKIGKIMDRAATSGNATGAVEAVLGVNAKQFSTEWKQAVLKAENPVLAATAAVPRSQVLIASSKPAAKLNVSPAVSPDGKWVMFFSERSLFAINLYLADAQTGKIIRKITETALSAHFNNLEFINSVGAWSSDSRRFAFGHVTAGRARISIYDLQRQRVTQSFPLPGVGDVFSPTWSPDGRQIAFTAITGGVTNLYLLNLQTGGIRAITHDMYAELQPAWSPDGREIAFTTDRFTTRLGGLAYGHFQVAEMDVASGAVRALAPGGGGDQTNPQWAPQGGALYFLSDANGIPNLYRLELKGGQITALTNLQTGISGITSLSPAFSVAARAGTVIYSAFDQGGYDLVRWQPSAAAAPGAAAAARLHPALLPPWTAVTGMVAELLAHPSLGLMSAAGFTTAPYHASLKLEAIVPPSIAVGVSSYGTLLGGGTGLLFGDLLGDRTLLVQFEALTSGGSGFFRNLSAEGVFLNQRHRWTWGFGGGQSPYVSGGFTAATGVINSVPVEQDQFFTLWELDRQAVGILAYPFNRAMRVEFSAGYRNIGFVAERETQIFDLTTGALIGDQRESIPAPPDLNFAVGSAALVYDTSIFGGVSPVLGQSYRIEAGATAGSIDFATALVDYRRYLGLTRWLSLAGRFLHFGRYGSGADNGRMQPLFLGYPALVRGYDYGSFSAGECGPQLNATGACPVFDRMLGSKIAVGNAELRIEILGPLGLLTTYAVPPVELAPFFDIGAAWTAAEKADFLGGPRSTISSEGLTLRVNLLGFAVGSISLVYPNNRPLRSHLWEFSLLPGF